MTPGAERIILRYPSRRTRAEKGVFRLGLRNELKAAGCDAKAEREEGKFGRANVLSGDPETASLIICARYDTPLRSLFSKRVFPFSGLLTAEWEILRWCLTAVVMLCAAALGSFAAAWFYSLAGRGSINVWVSAGGYAGIAAVLIFLLLPNRRNLNGGTSAAAALFETAASMDPALRKKVCFVFTDSGGAQYFRELHPAACEKKPVLFLDCVGCGDRLIALAGKGFAADERLCAALKASAPDASPKTFELREDRKPLCFEHGRFAVGATICAASGRGEPYIPRLGSGRDRLLDLANLRLVRDILINFAGALEAGNDEK